jgi:putative flavoprotein involved in K+ transport
MQKSWFSLIVWLRFSPELCTMNTNTLKNYWHTLVIGGGQAGLATGYHLKKMNIDFLIVDAEARTGDAWRRRWNSLRLFTPAWNNGLPGHPFPGNQNSFPTKDEAADFLFEYKEKFELPVLYDSRVMMVKKLKNGFQIMLKDRMLETQNLVIATGSYAIPNIPAFAKELNGCIQQLHSSYYKSPNDLTEGNILVVGAGTSGFQIALDLLQEKRTVFIAGKPTAQIPDFVFRYFGKQFVWMNKHILNTSTPMGRKFQARIMQGKGAPLIHISPEAAKRAGVKIVERLKSVQDGWPITESGEKIQASAILWCTGFHSDYSWMDLPGAIAANGYPATARGVSSNHPGLYFVGSQFQYSLTSTWLGGVGRDAGYIANHIRVNRKSNYKSREKTLA